MFELDMALSFSSIFAYYSRKTPGKVIRFLLDDVDKMDVHLVHFVQVVQENYLGFSG
jgi:hypothetical protein